MIRSSVEQDKGGNDNHGEHKTRYQCSLGTFSCMYNQSTKGSVVILGSHQRVLEKKIIEPCDLFVEDPLRRLVAWASVYNLGSTVYY